jgi:hypothetical protein
LEPESVAVCDALFDKEAFFRDEYSHETPNILAGWIMVNLCADGDLDVEPQQVVLGEAESADGRFRFYTAVRPMPVVSV